MILCIDIGNTAIKFAVYKVSKIVDSATMTTDKKSGKGSYIKILSKFKDITKVCLSTVVPEISNIMRDDIKEVFNIAPIEIGAGVKTGIRINANNPKELGSDIVAMCAAAADKYPGNKLVISLGTASVFTIMKDKSIDGVSIAPGINLSRKALAVGASKLRFTELAIEKDMFGKDTDSSINTGIIYSQVGAIKQMADNARKILGDITVIITGGYSELLIPYLECKINVEEELALDGLRIIGELNG